MERDGGDRLNTCGLSGGHVFLLVYETAEGLKQFKVQESRFKGKDEEIRLLTKDAHGWTQIRMRKPSRIAGAFFLGGALRNNISRKGAKAQRKNKKSNTPPLFLREGAGG